MPGNKSTSQATSQANWQQVKPILSNTLSMNFYYLKIVCIFHPSYHPKLIGYILKISKTTSMSVFMRL